MIVASMPTRRLLDAVHPPEGVATVLWDGAGAPDRADEVEVVVAPYMNGSAIVESLTRVPRVRLVQLQSAGYEDVAGIVPDGVALANAAGVHDAATAELAVGMTIAALRGLPDFVRAQDGQRWLPKTFRPSLADRRVLLLGYGSIGRATAARLAPFEVELTAVASRARPGDDLVAHVHGVDELPDLLPRAEVVIVLVPLTPATRRLVDDDFLGRLPDGALLVNVARGGVVDTDALLDHAGRVRAALDVTDPEPLPSGHPLWSAPDVLITPHVGGVASAMLPRIVDLVERQLAAYAGGGQLVNLVAHGGSPSM